MNALITGITGFVGSHLAEHLLACGDAVLGTDRQAAWPGDRPPRVRAVPLVGWKLPDPLTEAAFRQITDFAPQCIYHLAAISKPTDCGEREATPLARAVNVAGTEAVLRLAAGLPTRPRVLLVSSMYVYAPVPEDRPLVAEDWPLAPVRGYGKTKLAAEEALRRAVRQGGDGVIARAFMHTGPLQEPRYLLPEWAAQLAADAPATMTVRSLDTYLDLSDVRDVVRAYRLLIERGRRGEAYNVGAGRAVRSGDVLERLFELSGRRPDVRESEPGVRRLPIADLARIARDTGWRPAIPLEATIRETLSYWQRLAAG